MDLVLLCGYDRRVSVYDMLQRNTGVDDLGRLTAIMSK